MDVLVDGDVYIWQKRGGISRIYEKLLPAMEDLDSNLRCALAVPGRTHVPDSLRHCVRVVPQLPGNLRPWRLWKSVRPPLNNVMSSLFWRSRTADVFVSTYYTTPPVRARKVSVVYDMILEKFPEGFDESYVSAITARKRIAVETSDRVICISDRTREDVVSFYRIPESRCKTVYLAGSMDSAPALDASAALGLVGPFCLFVGQHRAVYKNFRLLFDSYMADTAGLFSDLGLVVVSPLDPLESEKQAASTLSDRRWIRFVKSCDDSLLAGLYRACNVFICPSFYEGFGIPVLEALNCGAPVVCSHAGSLPEIGGDAVFYFNPSSTEEFKHTLEMALCEGRDAAAVNRRLEQAVRFSWARTAGQFLDVLKEVLQ